MRILRRTTRVSASPERVFSVLEDPRLADDLNPPYLRTEVLQAPWLPKAGARTRLRLRYRSAVYEIETEIREYRRGAFLLEHQAAGPFAALEHAVSLSAVGEATELSEVVAYRVGLGPLGLAFDWLALRADLERLLATRHGRLRQMLEADAAGGAAERD